MLERADTAEAIGLNRRASALLDQFCSSGILKLWRTQRWIYTLLGSCRRHGLNPFDYLKDLFTRLPVAKITEIKQFTPALWAQANGNYNALPKAA